MASSPAPTATDTRRWSSSGPRASGRTAARHTITFKAWDEADNTTSKTITVTKVKRLPKVHTSAALGFEQLDATTVKVTGQVTSREGARRREAARQGVRGLPEAGHEHEGPARAGRQCIASRGRARRVITVTRTLKPGSWRVYLRYPGRKGFKKSRSKPVKFQIAAPV